MVEFAVDDPRLQILMVLSQYQLQLHHNPLQTAQQRPGCRGGRCVGIPIEAGTRKRVGILRVDRQAHDVMGMPLEHADALPALIPVPKLDGHVIARAEDEGLRRMDDNSSDVVGMLA